MWATQTKRRVHWFPQAHTAMHSYIGHRITSITEEEGGGAGRNKTLDVQYSMRSCDLQTSFYNYTVVYAFLVVWW